MSKPAIALDNKSILKEGMKDNPRVTTKQVAEAAFDEIEKLENIIFRNQQKTGVKGYITRFLKIW